MFDGVPARGRLLADPLTEDDLDALEAAAGDAVAAPLGDPGWREKALGSEVAWSLRWQDADGAVRIVGIGGICECWPGRGTAWALGADVPRRAWPEITRFAERQIAAALTRGFHRVDCSVQHDFGGGIVWCRRLGFEVEGYLERYGADGRDHLMYARLAPGSMNGARLASEGGTAG